MASQTDIQRLLKLMGERLRARRKALGLTQEKLAEMTDLAPTYVAKIEAGVRTPSLGTMVVLADALDIDPANLIRKAEETLDTEIGQRIGSAIAGLETKQREFVEEEILRLAAFLRRHSP